ncbi:3-[(3aS,4S,7aS)-7a-methyl-1,5-dioxo-octahydro-1H-inden-4-yl]propanoyl:CoA ligase (plasmid) [Caballeronia sp. SBC1]|uniref:class I adenylate-forming enzyme family protein n=1 Tax=unclassified Caballeronia TaxID=2646786 RepID=UPI0013E1F757|nr:MULTISPECIES: class I adenylate-forming enzyme family protein [unclassified Caballeronia]QIE26624.1 3-[(3aS,4S,7aS)-7a-methyl-1,5-dioxo-octahydro-1H-inden-4-yl]propanoyl:CoA ligase [Caballeronia sp. SBC2]QIN64060.1 3-[(3aS,4S,7aS)-7a-methyl-1,5-dioxo-octahydro-1H-inden-4-yl]propanoyl:CoA ligase [Caballeronia sp. SBC1]
MRLTIPQLLHHNVRHFAEKCAVTIDDHELSFQALARLVVEARNCFGPHVAPGDRVAIWMPNSFAWIASFLAIQELQGIAVPISTRLTAVEVSALIEDCGARVLAVLPKYRGRNYVDEAGSIDAQRASVIIEGPSDELKEDWRAHIRQQAVGANSPELPDGIFGIMYTSGTTSKPKGVMLTAESYIRTAQYAAFCQRLTPSTRFMSPAPFFHCSGSMHAITTSLVAGCTLHSMSSWDPERLLDLVEHHRADVSHGIFFRDVLSLGVEKVRTKLATLKLGYDHAGSQIMQLHDEIGISGISNLYGMTETSGMFTMWFPDDPLIKRVSANGRPQPGNEIRIVDAESGAPLSSDCLGEVQLRGPTITPGYFAQPEANRQAFTEDGWFRTGDLGSVSPDGELRYVARLKEIIRVGGENFAPAEVEEVLRSACQQQNLCVIGLPDDRLQEIPVAVIVQNGPVAWDEVLAGMRGRLAQFKVPRQVYVADALPTTPAGKVQRNVLANWIAEGKLTRVA